ncbi:MAG: hypothetical protein PHS84_14845, partial [Paludibacter sp.]|nr:hypothetical protein [Paludibacter sp.]
GILIAKGTTFAVEALKYTDVLTCTVSDVAKGSISVGDAYARMGSVIEAVSKYGADVLEVFGKYGFEITENIAKYGETAITAMKSGIEPSLITKLESYGIKPVDYIDLEIVNKEVADAVVQAEAEAAANLTDYLVRLETKPQVVINNEVGTAFEYFVEGTKLAHVDYDIQELYGIIDPNTGNLVQVRPDFTIKSLTTGDKVAFADAKTALSGRIPNDDQFKRLVWLTAQETTTGTLIYYIPSAGNYISKIMIDFAELYGVKILQVVAE